MTTLILAAGDDHLTWPDALALLGFFVVMAIVIWILTRS